MLKDLNFIRLIFLLFVAFSACDSEASGKSLNFSHCRVTNKHSVTNEPEFYRNYNDLTRKEGSFDNEYAEKIILRGLVVDKKCVPISDADIKIWQKDEYGDYRYVRNFMAPYEVYKMNYKMHRDVQEVGQASSNNNGRFLFITTPPGKEKKLKYQSPVNIVINHRDLHKYEGKIILNKDNINQPLKQNKFITAELNQSASDYLGVEVYDFYIVLNGYNKYRRY